MGTTALALGFGAHRTAAQSLWEGGLNPDCDTAANWDTDVIPTAAADMALDVTSVATNPMEVFVGANVATGTLDVSDNAFFVNGAIVVTNDVVQTEGAVSIALRGKRRHKTTSSRVFRS